MFDYIEIISTDKEGAVKGIFSDSPAPSVKPMEDSVKLVEEVARDGTFLTEEKINAIESVTRGLPTHLDAFLAALARGRVERVAGLINSVDGIERVLFSNEVVGEASVSQLIKIHQQANFSLEDSIRFLKDLSSQKELFAGFPMFVDARTIQLMEGEQKFKTMSPGGREKVRALANRIRGNNQ